MNCREARTLLHALLDGELDLVHQVEVEAHVGDCPACARAYQNLLTLEGQVSDRALRFRAPAGLRRRIEQAARSGAETPARGLAPESSAPWLWRRGWAVAAAAAVMLLVVSGAWIWQSRRAARDAFAQEIVAAHIRSLLPGHLTDVASSDQHNVKPWFAGRVDFSPTVPDLATSGFPLVGGRVDYVGSRTVAVLVYKRRQHVINVFTWPSSAHMAAPAMSINGYNVLSWSGTGMTCLAVSDLNTSELRQFVDLARRAIGP